MFPPPLFFPWVIVWKVQIFSALITLISARVLLQILQFGGHSYEDTDYINEVWTYLLISSFGVRIEDIVLIWDFKQKLLSTVSPKVVKYHDGYCSSFRQLSGLWVSFWKDWEKGDREKFLSSFRILQVEFIHWNWQIIDLDTLKDFFLHYLLLHEMVMVIGLCNFKSRL